MEYYIPADTKNNNNSKTCSGKLKNGILKRQSEL